MRTRMGSKLRMCVPALMCLGIPWTNIAAQKSGPPSIRVEAVGSINWVSLHDGELYDSGNSAWGFMGSLAFRRGQRLGAEVFMEFTPSNQESHKQTPQLLSSGAWITLSLTPDPARAFDLFIAAGAAYVDISDWPDIADCDDYVCVIPDRLDFKRGGAFSFIFGSGITYQLPGPFSLRLDVRLPSKSSVLGERTVRLGGGVGFRVR